jgi:FtsP/CotA-like multicopper oxidase with cupredoxin domain
LLDPNDPNGATTFFITVDGQTPTAFDPGASVPSIIVKQRDVEDWIIENRSTELHAFHIHQIHFMMIDWSGVPVNEPFLRDTVNVPYYNGRTLEYPSVRLRMDFRGPNSGHFCLSLSHSRARRQWNDGPDPCRACRSTTNQLNSFAHRPSANAQFNTSRQ